ncbi:vesicle transport protein [Globomyces pollinis-pini]|nr:vesicle transport protein [Globomyces pollinis-pini]
MWLSDTQKIGVGLTGFGVFFMILGILMFFDGGFLAIGNILFLGGITCIIGFSKTITFFGRREKIRGTVCFFLGVLLVFLKWAFVGVFLEAFGFINLFGDFLPVVVNFLRNVPIIGNILNLPGIAFFVDKLTGAKLPV